MQPLGHFAAKRWCRASAVLVLGGGVSAVASAPRDLGVRLHLGAKPRHHGLSTAHVRAGTRKVSQRVIVVLKNQFRAHPASAASVGTRARLEARARRPLLAKVRRSGGTVTQQFRAVNAFAGTVSSAERARLLGDRRSSRRRSSRRASGSSHRGRSARSTAPHRPARPRRP
jgi:hypothetical protein